MGSNGQSAEYLSFASLLDILLFWRKVPSDLHIMRTKRLQLENSKHLIEQVSDEANRLQLAKASYRNITDPANFSQMYELLNTQSSKNDLSAYVSSYARY